MDIKIFFNSIMTDAKGSKSNIAAKFQNALNFNFLPPIGVFWDIENCQVPKGKSAIALVQNIRERFFAHHREAEFMCVCDINKESKTVIQELILAQVTVVHISATSKNAADDKLKQCMRRFVDTHGAPSTLLLISDDVNFSSDLSDFRHRHNIRIILLHRARAHQSLITCAHEHYEFASVACDLPPRTPSKSTDKRPNVLLVTNLPMDMSFAQIKILLSKLSQNCGGKVSEVRRGEAFVKFATPDAAERAQKRMDKEPVFGNIISVNFHHRTDCDFHGSPLKRNKDTDSSNDASGASCSSRDSSASPTRDSENIRRTYSSDPSCGKFDFPPPPVLDSQTYPSLLKNNSKEFETYEEWASQKFQRTSMLFPLPSKNIMEVMKENKHVQLDWNHNVSNNQSTKNSDISAFLPFKNDIDSKARYSQKNVGRVSPFVMQECDKTPRSSHSDPGNVRRENAQIGNLSGQYVFSNPCYPSAVQNIDSSFEIHRISEPYVYSPCWNGAGTGSDSVLTVTRNNQMPSLDNSSGVELYVSNLDPSFEVNHIKSVLFQLFRDHVMVLHISMCIQPDGSAKATVKVPSFQDAQYAISRLQRKKIGHKRILISHALSDKCPPFHILKSEVIALLNDIPNKSLPLIKFRELYEKRYHRPIAVSELYKMRETVIIQGDSGCRIVCLNTEFCNTPSLPESEDSQELNSVEKPFCEVHFQVLTSQGWAEQYNICPLPLVHMSLRNLSLAVHTLLHSHQGSLPLISFRDCYEAEIGPLPIVDNIVSGQEYSVELSDQSASQTSVKQRLKGVPLEHLVACIAGVEVTKSYLCIKKVQWVENRTDIQAIQNLSPALMGQLTQFGREVMDLLKSQPQCLVQFNKFIPTYHHHFGRQCRVADYGFTKLIDLLEAMPHIVQVLGEGQNRQVTLTHRTQVKRFSAELQRVLKSRASKQVAVSEFTEAYEEVTEKKFDITNYGVCEIEDLLDEVPESLIVTSISGSEKIISIPKREQTLEEIERTKQFADEVVKLLKGRNDCSMEFNYFIPSYHHLFMKQCRVADYGFTKLIELFEAIPHVLEVRGTGDNKVLVLVEEEQHKILIDRLVTVLRAQPTEMVDMTQLCSAYAQVHGHALRPSDFGFSDLTEMLNQFKNIFKIISHSGRPYACLLDKVLIHEISYNIRRILMDKKNGSMPIGEVWQIYEARYGPNAELSSYLNDLVDIIVIKNGTLHLTPLQLLARDIILLLQENGGKIPLCHLGSYFQQRFKVPICVSNHGFSNMYAMLGYLSDYFIIKGKKQEREVQLQNEIADCPLKDTFHPPKPPSQVKPSRDILNEPGPSSIPTPSIEHKKTQCCDLMGFEAPPVQDIVHPANSSEYCHATESPSAVIPCATQTSRFPAASTLANVQFSKNQKVSYVDALAYTSPFKYTNPFMHLHQPSAVKFRDPTLDFLQEPEMPICPVINVPKQHVFELEHKQLEVNHVRKNSVEHNSSEHLDNFISSPSIRIDPQSVQDQYNNHPSSTKDEAPNIKNGASSTKGTPTSESKQSRRNRIAAQFSSPINE